jgi:hypothetical protein
MRTDLDHERVVSLATDAQVDVGLVERILQADWRRNNVVKIARFPHSPYWQSFGNLQTYIVHVQFPDRIELDVVLKRGTAFYLWVTNASEEILADLDLAHSLFDRSYYRGWPEPAMLVRFVRRYLEMVPVYLAEQMRQDQENPQRRFDTQLMDGIYELFSPAEQGIRWELCLTFCKRASLRNYDERDSILRCELERSPEHLACVESIDQANQHIIETLYEWWLGHCVDFTLPPAPEMREHALLLQQFHLYRRVEQIGQVVCCPDPQDEKRTLFVEIWMKQQITARFRREGEDKDTIKAANRWTARELHRLCDWRLYNSLTRRQQRAIGVRVQQILQTSFSLDNTLRIA